MMDESSLETGADLRRGVRSHRELEAWQAAMELVEACYELTGGLPDTERFGLRGQMRSAAVSIASNIAEGFGRRGLRAYLYHLRIAKGSHGELDTQVELVRRLSMAPADRIQRIEKPLIRAGQLLSGLIRSLERLASVGVSPKP